ncbi:hypothetical protein XELAEV_18022948mg [Xenopus laevis]|uniref:Uncharacterized protein n=1 Tax=Xenopus laevis TaxID=8355 RepID=A0A974D5W9_XENLA|nr:hypothetical protein XELAEV_18022948mg [Xenopus laevis]
MSQPLRILVQLHHYEDWLFLRIIRETALCSQSLLFLLFNRHIQTPISVLQTPWVIIWIISLWLAFIKFQKEIKLFLGTIAIPVHCMRQTLKSYTSK